MKRSLVVVAAVLAVTVMASNAMAISVAYDNGTTYYTTSISQFGTTGDDMAGMMITAYFADQTTDTAYWAVTGFESGAAVGNGWSLSESGTTYSNDWILTNTGTVAPTGAASGPDLVRLVIDAGLGDTVFDVIWPEYVTDGTAEGWEIDTTATGLATYRDRVALTGDAPLGDIWRTLDIQLDPGLAVGNSLTFVADTDNLSISGDLDVPEPGTMALLGVGLLGIGGAVIRRRRRS
jgi:hypothetical protein